MLLSTWFGCGFFKPAPGTSGSLAALPIAWVLTKLGGYQALIVATIIITYNLFTLKINIPSIKKVCYKLRNIN